MKKYLIISLCVGLLNTAIHGRLISRLSKIGAALGITRSNSIPDRFRPDETWLHPNTLFHGSPYTDIEMIKPKSLANRCKGQPIVFASHHIGLASLFMLKHHGKFACGRLPNGDIFYMTDDKRRCITEDHGGAIYVVSATTFFCEAHVSLGVDEWISYAAVKPLSKFTLSSALEAILEFGVKVYFVDKHTYAEYWRLGSGERGWNAFFKPLKPCTKEQLASERALLAGDQYYVTKRSQTAMR